MSAAWKLALGLVIVCLFAAGLTVLAGAALLAGADGTLPAVTVHIDGETVRLPSLGDRELLFAFAALAALLIVASVAVPLALLLAGGVLVLAVVIGLAALLGVFALLLLPLWLPLLWWWRRRPAAPPAAP